MNSRAKIDNLRELCELGTKLLASCRGLFESCGKCDRRKSACAARRRIILEIARFDQLMTDKFTIENITTAGKGES